MSQLGFFGASPTDSRKVAGVVIDLGLFHDHWAALVDTGDGSVRVRGTANTHVPPRGRTVTVYCEHDGQFLWVQDVFLHGVEEHDGGHVASFSLAQKFEHFHKLNPQVLWHIEQIVRDLRKAGHQYGSVNLIFERLRWLYALSTRGDSDGFLLNNNHRAFYARVLMKLRPDLDGFFRLRKQVVPYDPDLESLGLLESA